MKFESSIPCQIDAELFFAESPGAVEQAKALCGMCPLRRDCLQMALDRNEPWGIWGGEIFQDGVIIPVKRPRGRPRKAAA